MVQAADRAASLPMEPPQAPASQSTDDTRSEVSVDTAQQRLTSHLGSSSQAPSSPAGSARMYTPEEDAVAQPPARALLPHRLPFGTRQRKKGDIAIFATPWLEMLTIVQ